MKLILGTAQFGSNYGIQNIHGKINKKASYSILSVASKNNLTFIDTAYSYGPSERIIGSYIHLYRKQFSVISKVPKVPKYNIHTLMRESLKRLNIKSFYGYLIHDMEAYWSNPTIYEQILEAKKMGLTKKTGFSLYFPKDLEYLFKKRVNFDLIQIPFNCFDQRFIPYLAELTKRGIEIHIRSVFLQGLFYKNPQSLPTFFNPIKEKLHALQEISLTDGIPLPALCLQFVMTHNVDKIIVGVHTPEDLKNDISATTRIKRITAIIPKLMKLKVSNQSVILPIYWPK